MTSVADDDSIFPLHVVRASEIGEYTYCARAWWLRNVRGVHSTHQALMREGTRRHHHHARQVSTAVWAGKIAWTLILLALLFIGLAILRSWIGG